jgi:hypothetical protein
MADYVVATNGVDDAGRSGSEAQPYASVTWTITNKMNAGDRVLVRGGNYQQRITTSKGGTGENARITIENYPNELPEFQGVNGLERIAHLNQNYVTLKGLRFEYGHAAPGGNSRFPWIYISGGSADAHHISVVDCKIERDGWQTLAGLLATTWDEWGIQVDSSDYALLQGNWIRGVNQGIQVKGPSRHCYILENDIQHTYASCIVMAESGGVMRKAVIRRNTLGHSAIEDGIQFMQSFGANSATDTSNWGTLIDWNWIFGNSENAIDIKGTLYIIAQNNLIWSTVGSNNGWLEDDENTPNRIADGAITRGARTKALYMTVRNNVLVNNCGGVNTLPYMQVFKNTFIHNNHDLTGPESTYTDANNALFRSLYHREKTLGGQFCGNIVIGHKHADIVLRLGFTGEAFRIGRNIYGSNKWRDADERQTYTSLNAWIQALAAKGWGDGDSTSRIATRAEIGFVSVPALPTGDARTYNFNLQPTSVAKGAAGPILYAANSGSNSTNLKVPAKTAHALFDGFGDSPYAAKDKIWIRNQVRTVQAINWTGGLDTITLDQPATWQNNDPIYWSGTDEPTNAVDAGASPFQDAAPPPPPPSGTGSMRGFWFNASTGGGTQTVPIPEGALGAAPNAFLFFWTNATASSESPVDGAVFGMGAASTPGGIAQWAGGVRSRHANSGAQSSRRNSNTACIHIMTPTANSCVGEGALTGTPTANSLQINWLTTPDQAYLIFCIPVVAKNAKAVEQALHQTQNSGNAVSAGFAWNSLFAYRNGKDIPNSSANAHISLGIATYQGGTLKQRALSYVDESIASPSTSALRASTDRVLGFVAATTGNMNNSVELTSPTSSGVTVTTRDGNLSTAEDCGLLFLEFENLDLYCEFVQVPAAASGASPDSYTVGFAADFVLAAWTHLLSVGGAADGRGSALGLGFYDKTRQGFAGIATQDGITVSNTESRLITGRIGYLVEHDGTVDAAHIATATGVDSTKVYIDYDTVGANEQILLFALEGSVQTSIEASSSATPLTGVAPLTVNFTGSAVANNTSVTTHAWTFGTGATSSAQNPQYTYSEAGEYQALYTAGNGSISDTADPLHIVVTAPPPPPPTPTASPTVKGGVSVGHLPFATVKGGVTVL